MAMNSAVVTGVSSGIGRAIAKSLIDDGWRVFGSVRKEEDAAQAQETLGNAFEPLIFDVTDRDAIDESARRVGEALAGRRLQGLVNNAGITVSGPLRYLNEDRLRRQLDVNLFGALRVTQAFLDLLGADPARQGRKGRIINMSSAAGEIGWPLQGPYSMSKHALEAFSESLRRELMPHKIDVIVIGPGAVKTPIWDKGGEIDAEDYRDTEYYEVLRSLDDQYKELAENGLEPSAIGELARDILNGKKTRTRYAPMNNKLAMWTLPRALPPRWLDRILYGRMGLSKAKPEKQ